MLPFKEQEIVVSYAIMLDEDVYKRQYLLLADALKEDAKVAIDNLKALNIENIQILSGDKQSIVTTVSYTHLDVYKRQLFY